MKLLILSCSFFSDTYKMLYISKYYFHYIHILTSSIGFFIWSNVSFFTHTWEFLKICVLFINVLFYFPNTWECIIPLLISSLFILWSKNILRVFSILLKLLRYILWPTMLPILMNALRKLEKNIFCFCWMEYFKNVAYTKLIMCTLHTICISLFSCH